MVVGPQMIQGFRGHVWVFSLFLCLVSVFVTLTMWNFFVPCLLFIADTGTLKMGSPLDVGFYSCLVPVSIFAPRHVRSSALIPQETSICKFRFQFLLLPLPLNPQVLSDPSHSKPEMILVWTSLSPNSYRLLQLMSLGVPTRMEL